MHCLMLLSSRRWVCVLSVSVRGRIGELMLSKGARIARSRPPSPAGLCCQAEAPHRALPIPLGLLAPSFLLLFAPQKLQNVMAVTEVLALLWQTRRGPEHGSD
jgi:hypothetical protein